jgi:signal transduction histidine kinase
MSLSTRIIVRVTITTFVAFGAYYGWLYLKQSHVEGYLSERALVRQAQEISNFISVNDNGSIDFNLPSQLLEAYNSPGSQYRYAIRDEVGRIVATSNRRAGALPEFMPSQHHHTYEYISEDAGKRLVGAAFRTTIGQRTFTTQVEQTAPELQSLSAAVFNEFIIDGGWLGIPFLAALLGITALTVKKTLAPLDELANLAAQINPGTSEVRLPHIGVPREILPLVSSINKALDRLDDGLRRQQDFNANAAHQLRTPLAVLSANIDIMDDKIIAAKLRYDVELMSRIVTQLLLVARLETLNIRLDEQVELSSAVRNAAENLGPVAISMSKTIEVDEPAGQIFVRGNGPVIIAAVSNLIENALNHSLIGGIVRIRVTSTPSIEVHDSGPGIPPEMREKVFERFWRGENSKEGAGLGLSIVRRIMHALNGSVSVSDALGGGAQFTLVFPAFRVAPPPDPGVTRSNGTHAATIAGG